MSGFEIPQGFRAISGERSPPKDGSEYEVIFRNGYRDEKHTYTAEQLRWVHDGSDWDVIAVRKV